MSIDPSYRHKHLRRSGTSTEADEFNPDRETRVLVLYTGGTIGMKVHDGGEIHIFATTVACGRDCSILG